jgi:Tol biopolymer transport system component
MDLYVKPLAGAVGSEQLLLSDDTGKYPFSWSPDGQIVMYGTIGQNQNLFYVSVDGHKTATPFVQTSFSEYAAQFSPDGKWVAYRSNESGRPEVWIAPFPEPGKRTQVSTDGVAFGYPRWRRDGKELFFLDTEARLMAAAIDLRGPEAIRESVETRTVFTR